MGQELFEFQHLTFAQLCYGLFALLRYPYSQLMKCLLASIHYITCTQVGCHGDFFPNTCQSR